MVNQIFWILALRGVQGRILPHVIATSSQQVTPRKPHARVGGPDLMWIGTGVDMIKALANRGLGTSVRVDHMLRPADRRLTIPYSVQYCPIRLNSP